jgi:alpha-D-xyloside xylohydrolase
MRPAHRTDFVPDPDRYSDFFGLIKDIRNKGIEVCLWENPYVSSLSELYDEGCEKGYFAKDPQGNPYPYQWVPSGLPGFPQTPVSGLVDFTNTDAVQWWKQQHEPFLRAGVKCFKTDFGEEIPWDAVFADGRSGFELRNTYSDLYNIAVTEAISDVHGDDGLIWARSGYRNTQATPVKWAGDGQTDWRSLRATLRAGLSQAFGGALFWSHDVGGFYGPAPEPELYLRWAQFAMWCSHVRCHGTSPREPWEFGQHVLEIFRASWAVRESLRPYFLETYNWSVATGQSFIRPLVFSDGAPLASRWLDDVFWAGRDVIVAPFLSPVGGRDVWLPQGEWVDLRTGALVTGPKEFVTQRSAFLPVFYRATSPFAASFAKATQIIQAASPGKIP